MRREPRIAVLFDMFGPYHLARIDALGRVSRTLGVEIAARSRTYAWEPLHRQLSFERRTLFDVCDSGQLDYPTLAGAVGQALSSFDPDAVLIPGWASRAALAALAWCSERGRSAVAMSESTFGDHVRRPWKEALKRQIVRCFDAGLVGGEPQRRYLTSLGLPESRVALGYNVVDNAHFADASGAARNSLDASAMGDLPERYFLASARFIPIKNLTGLLQAFAGFIANPQSPRVDLVLLGDGEQRPALEAERDRLGLRDRVRLPGFVQYDELPRYYARAEAFVHVSRFEPWGLVVNEAMAAGLPVIVSRECGCAETLVREGVNGFVTPFDRSDLIAERLQRLAGDPGLRRAMGAASAEIIAPWSPARFAAGAIEAVELTKAGSPRRRRPARGAMLHVAGRAL